MTDRLRRQRPCVIRMTTDLHSPRCGQPAVEKREDNEFWVCAEHRLYGQTFTRNPGVLPADRGARRRAPFTTADLLGNPVIVENPHTGDVWRGQAIASSTMPSILIEQSDGERMMLPLDWARPRR
ncbi:hypothetical protein HOT42_gp08 [Microbacterium phage Metamorphoo]|uniref:Uncharacterized protein n=1 Tax=Microbacterium phage Metamorphoo TaxID=2201437 RepID=A0A2Z4Q6G3_9CAUD|nr:hypothetical protein HOT42_gp08 [Microbacterium phage Metamorphoo]AWY05359.1 hypothetical protein SEA_METAMORPHOO_8 [Microbacterium phage Metamorphoo]